jgi:hypothetical protein
MAANVDLLTVGYIDAGGAIACESTVYPREFTKHIKTYEEEFLGMNLWWISWLLIPIVTNHDVQFTVT